MENQRVDLESKAVTYRDHVNSDVILLPVFITSPGLEALNDEP